MLNLLEYVMPFLVHELDLLIGWMVERDRVRTLKEAGQEKPWTQDQWLLQYRWCNVRRMDDRVSRALATHWYSEPGDDILDLVAATLARLVNWPDSLFEISGHQPFKLDHLHHMRERLLRRASAGEKVFTGAYVIPGVPGQDKVTSVCALVDRVHEKASDVLARSMQTTWANLLQFEGLGSFLAGQIVADLASIGAGQKWRDSRSWAPVGPGSARGLNRLLGRPKAKAVTQLEFDELLPEVIISVRPRVQSLWDDRKLIAMDIQNCLCEFDKMRRLQLGEGTVRARYDGLGPRQMSWL